MYWFALSCLRPRDDDQIIGIAIPRTFVLILRRFRLPLPRPGAARANVIGTPLRFRFPARFGLGSAHPRPATSPPGPAQGVFTTWLGVAKSPHCV
jgi:hypothetical protein